MLMPKKVKFRNQHKGNMRGMALRGSNLSFGDFALQALECGRVTARQIEAGRIAISRHVKRGGKMWIRIFPDKPVTKKPAEVRMGKGKGAVERYEAYIKAGRILYEMGGVTREVATEALGLAAAKLPLRTKLLIKSEDPWE